MDTSKYKKVSCSEPLGVTRTILLPRYHGGPGAPTRASIRKYLRSEPLDVTIFLLNYGYLPWYHGTYCGTVPWVFHYRSRLGPLALLSGRVFQI